MYDDGAGLDLRLEPGGHRFGAEIGVHRGDFSAVVLAVVDGVLREHLEE